MKILHPLVLEAIPLKWRLVLPKACVTPFIHTFVTSMFTFIFQDLGRMLLLLQPPQHLTVHRMKDNFSLPSWQFMLHFSSSLGNSTHKFSW